MPEFSSSPTQICRVSVESSADDWTKQGRRLFTNGSYSQAAFCFEKADMPWWQGVAELYHKRHAAEQMPLTQPGRDTVFRTLGRSFWVSAGTAFSSEDGQDLYLQAANCFVEAREHVLAAQGFVRCQRYTEAVLQYRSAELLDEAMEIIDRHKADVDQDVTDTIVYLAQLAYTRKRDTK